MQYGKSKSRKLKVKSGGRECGGPVTQPHIEVRGGQHPPGTGVSFPSCARVRARGRGRAAEGSRPGARLTWTLTGWGDLATWLHGPPSARHLVPGIERVLLREAVQIELADLCPQGGGL